MQVPRAHNDTQRRLRAAAGRALRKRLLPSDFETGKTYELSGDAALPLRPEVHGMPI